MGPQLIDGILRIEGRFSEFLGQRVAPLKAIKLIYILGSAWVSLLGKLIRSSLALDAKQSALLILPLATFEITQRSDIW